LSNVRDARAGVSYSDVDAAIRDIMKEYNCNVHYAFTTPHVSGTSVLFWVAIHSEPRYIGKKTVRAKAVRSRRWPHVDHQTMAGLMLWLAYDLSSFLEQQGMVPVQEALFD